MSRPLESFLEKIWVIVNILAMKINRYSIENNPNEEVIIKNQNVNPAVTATDLNLGEDVFI